MKICLVTGGTGGHIYPALALADKWKSLDPSIDILFIGNDNRMEADLIPSYGYQFASLHTSGLVGNVFSKMKAIGQMFLAYNKAKSYLKEFKPDMVMGFGGYVSAPVLMAAHSLSIPVAMHEQNSIVGKANQLVMKKANVIFTCYEKCNEVFPKEKIHLYGNPRATVACEAKFDEAYFQSLGLDLNKKTILIMMGSLGSSSINKLMKDSLKGNFDRLQFLYVCGKNNEDDMSQLESENIHVVNYVDTLRIYSHVDGMICRAGATTIAELTALGIPSILIPSPYVAENHQYYNAKELVDQRAAYMIEEKDLDAKHLNQAIQDLFGNEEEMKLVKQAALSLGKPKAAYDIISLCQHMFE
ncbi:undecaprenyldiphospho-muramoylpentapeptide beta-N-acetylglucosaminyltransferase [Floccifex sp.]|uniref:undecaprenyldiphospho-muramoylpentapeptide beta-N-acetylglucosaminyltransferase n=1 Tax=Floccifex sp. TaxID=2815810 RepID=UPI002A75028F|nr:undecaprenyldiphospho-muramoylpentapeptide beta-N-acetylglucosaminyltransferase [Floccifex sp.]MDY2958400.1 undecaprenyldiphospho-muramoylpentapeptide beta-N-acetylglucosaminyltransferase [Floccifex sp.]